jgi:hypothetical protein
MSVEIGTRREPGEGVKYFAGDFYHPQREWTDYAKIAGVVALIAVVGFFATDFTSGLIMGKGQAKYAQVCDKEYKTWTTTDNKGHTTRHEEWRLKLIVADSEYSEICVDHGEYDAVKCDDWVRVKERRGGITGWSYGYHFEAKVAKNGIPKEGGS